MSADQARGLGAPEPLQDLSQLKRRAKELLRGFRASNTEALSTVEEHFDGADPRTFRLAQAQLVVARGLGFPSWTKLIVAAGLQGGEPPMRRTRAKPRRMVGKQYVYDVDPVDSDLAWELFEACRAGDVGAVRAMLEKDPNLVHAQHWYTQPLHFAAYANQHEVVDLLLDAGAEPGRTRYQGQDLPEVFERLDHLGLNGMRSRLEKAATERHGFVPEFSKLESAIRTRRVTEIEAVLTDRPDLATAADARGNNAIHWLVMARLPELLAQLVERGADPNARRSDGQTPAHVAFNGDYYYRTGRELRGIDVPEGAAVAKRLVEVGAEYDLSVASALGDLDRVDALLRADPSLARRLDSGRRSPLMYSARGGHLEIVRTLLAHGADPNAPEDLADRGAALFAACAANRIDIVELLLQHGADPNAGEDSSGVCVYIAARRHGDAARPLVELLYEHGAQRPHWEWSVEEFREAIACDDPFTRDPDVELDMLARNDVGLVGLMLERDPGLVDRLSGGSLRCGSPEVSIKDSEVLTRLLDAGFDPNRPSWVGKTPLHHYAGNGEVGNLELLLERGADIDAIDDEYHSTPLGWAAREGRVEAVRLLVAHGADPGLPEDMPGARAVEWARRGEQKEHEEILSILEAVGAP